MRYCLNPTCPQPQNSDGAEHCQACGALLRLGDRYWAIKLLGQGGFGRTFLAIDDATPERPCCVIKQSWPHPTACAASDASAQFREEALRLQALGTHPQIPSLLAYMAVDDRQYLIQEFIDGPTLEQELAATGPFSEAQIWQLLNDLLPIVQFIHNHHIIHRDIKPANIIRQTATQQLVLVDLGAAKCVTGRALVETNTVIGSAEYTAPEQAKGRAVFASDLYSVGVTCIHLLTQLSPFDLFDTMTDRWIWQQYLPAPVSDRLAVILDRLIQSALSQRFQSANQVMQAIGRPALPDQSLTIAPNSQSGTLFYLSNAPWQCQCTLTGHTASVNAVAICPTRPILASSSEDKTIRLWELQTGRATTAVLDHVQAVRAIAFSPNGETIASGGQDKAVILTQKWYIDIAGRSEILGQHLQAVTAIAFTPSGQLLASASRDKTIKLWDLAAKGEICTVKGHRLNVTAIAFSPNGRFLASASADHTVCLWTAEANLTIQLRFTLLDHVGPVQAIAFSLDSQLLATGGDDRTIKLWSTQTGRLLRTLPGHSWTVSALTFTPDGSTLISASWDGTLKLWRLGEERSEPAFVLTGHTDSINAIALSSDGKTLITGSSDKTIRIWQAVG